MLALLLGLLAVGGEMISPKYIALKFSFAGVQSRLLFSLFAVKFKVTEPDWRGDGKEPQFRKYWKIPGRRRSFSPLV